MYLDHLIQKLPIDLVVADETDACYPGDAQFLNPEFVVFAVDLGVSWKIRAGLHNSIHVFNDKVL